MNYSGYIMLLILIARQIRIRRILHVKPGSVTSLIVASWLTSHLNQLQYGTRACE